MQTLTEQQALDRLRSAVKQAGGLHAYGRLHGFTASYIHDVLAGKRGLADRILSSIGIERVTIYQLKGNDE